MDPKGYVDKKNISSETPNDLLEADIFELLKKALLDQSTKTYFGDSTDHIETARELTKCILSKVKAEEDEGRR